MKSARRRSRELATQGLYQWLLSGAPGGEIGERAHRGLDVHLAARGAAVRRREDPDHHAAARERDRERLDRLPQRTPPARLAPPLALHPAPRSP